MACKKPARQHGPFMGKRIMKKIVTTCAGRIRTCDLRGMSPASFLCSTSQYCRHKNSKSCDLLPFGNSAGDYIHVQTGILGLEPTARFYGSCFLPLGKIFRWGPNGAIIRVFGLRRFSANENPAKRVGYDPTVHLQVHAGFQDRCNKPTLPSLHNGPSWSRTKDRQVMSPLL